MAKLNAAQQARDLFEQLKQKAGGAVNQIAQAVPTVMRSSGFNPAINQPRVHVNTPQGAKLVADYARGQVITPIRQGLTQPSKPGLINKIPQLMQVAGGVLSATPGGIAYNTGTGIAAGAIRSFKTGENLNKSIRRGVTQPTSIASDALDIKNPIVASAVDVALSRSPKSIIKDPSGVKGVKKIITTLNTPAKVKGLTGTSPNIYNIHPQDEKVLNTLMDKVLSKAKLQKLDNDNLQALATHYLGGDWKGANSRRIALAFQSVLAKKRGGIAGGVPSPYKMGFAAGGGSIKDELLQPPAPARMSQKALDAGITTPRTGADISVSPQAQQRYAAVGGGQSPHLSIDPSLPRTPGEVGSLPGKAATNLVDGQPKLNTSGGSIPQFDSQAYIKELTQRKNDAGSSGPQGIAQKGRSFLGELKSKLVDSVAPIEDALSAAEKKGKFKVLPKNDVRLQVDRVLRAKSLGAQFAKDNGLEQVIKNAPDLEALDQYMIAKQAARVSELGKQTGRNSAKDAQLVQALAPEYEQYAQTVSQYSRKLLNYSVESGLVDKNLAQELITKYPDYVPLQRVFNELERNTYQGSGKAIASISKQSVVQKLEGSNREIQSPIESILLKTQTAFEQGEKNKAAKMLTSYKDLPGFEGLVRELKDGEKAAHTVSYLDNGIKKTFETTPEIAAAAKNLNQEQMNIVLKILSVPTRVLQLGATGLNIPFVVTNIAKDQVTAFINSNKAARTSLMNPLNFGRALFSAVKHDDLYNEVVRQGGMQTSFDISRSQANLSVAKIRAGKNVGSKVAYTATHPAELLRGIEDIIGRAEETTRIQQYRGTYKALIAEHRTPQDARLLAAQAARDNTANFARKGDIGKVINYVIPFFNAGIQGARVFTRNLKDRPLETGSKLAVGVFMPVAATTLWNMNDPKRKEAYDDIDEFEKQNNLILIPDNPTKDAKGRWNVVKIPLPPGLSNLGTIVRKSLEGSYKLDPSSFADIANNILTATTSIDASSPNKLASTFTPQAVKPVVESITNTNLFSGKPIVPQSLQGLPVTEQAQPYTSGTARLVGKATGQSPLKVENFVRTAAGGVGSQLLNASDTVLNKAGVIPAEQVGGEGPGSQIERRFRKASGGSVDEKGATEVKKVQEQSALDSYNRKQEAIKLYKELKKMPPDQAFEKYKALKDEKPLLFKALKTHAEDEKLGLTYKEKTIKGLGIEDGTRAKYIAKEFKSLKTKEEKAKLWDEWVKKKIITTDTVRQLNYLKQKGEL